MFKPKTIANRLLTLAVALQVFNISLNLNDFSIGKAGSGYVYINEIETVVEFVAEIIMEQGDVIPESQVPGGSLGFEEEETGFLEKSRAHLISLNTPYIFYLNQFIHPQDDFCSHTSEVTTPPPEKA